MNKKENELNHDYLVSVNPILHERLVKLVNILMRLPQKTNRIEILSNRDGYGIRNMIFTFKSKYGDKYIEIYGGTGGNIFNFRYYNDTDVVTEPIFEAYVYKNTDREPYFIQKKLNGNIIDEYIREIEDYIEYEY